MGFYFELFWVYQWFDFVGQDKMVGKQARLDKSVPSESKIE